MTQRTQFDRAYATGEEVSGTQPEGTPFVNFPDRRLQVQGPTGPIDLLAVRPFSADADYAAGEIVGYSGKFYAANTTVTAGAFDAGEWDSLTAGQFDEVLQGVDWDFTISYNGDGNAEEIVDIRDPLRMRTTVTYNADGSPDVIAYETSTDSGGAYTPAGTLTLSYTDGDPTGGTWS